MTCLLLPLLECSVQKLESMALVQKEVMARVERLKSKTSKDEQDSPDYFFVEKARPFAGATYAIEKPDELLVGE